MRQELRVAIRAAKLAGKFALESTKEQRMPVEKDNLYDFYTEADLEAERLILEMLQNHFPEYGVLAEESGEKFRSSEFTWVVDPIDGTSNFFHGLPYYCISIALVRSMQDPVLGVVYAPTTRELFWALEGEGARCNGKRLSVAKNKEFRKLMAIVALKNQMFLGQENKQARAMRALVRRRVMVRFMGAAALSLANVAAGRADTYLTYGTKPWDVAAGVLLVREAGGVAFNSRGHRWRLCDSMLIAGSKIAVEKVAKTVKFFQNIAKN
jgi:myo-inositol-1(or 4)-monophosphatase